MLCFREGCRNYPSDEKSVYLAEANNLELPALLEAGYLIVAGAVYLGRGLAMPSHFSQV